MSALRLGAPVGPTSLGAAGRQSAGGERGDPGVEPRGVPAARPAVERVRTGADRLVRQAPPVGQVVPALVARTRPVRDLVAAPACGGKPLDGVLVLRGRTVLVLLRAGAVAPASRAGGVGRWSPAGPVRPSAARIVEGQRVEREVVRRQCERGVERARPRTRGSGRARRRAGRGSATRCSPARLGDGLGDVARRDVAGRAAAARRRSRLCAPKETRVTPGVAARPRGRPARRTRVRLERDLGVGRDTEAVTDVGAGSGRAVPRTAATASRRRGRRTRAAAGAAPNAGSRLVGAQLDLAQERVDERRDAVARPRAPPRPGTRRSRSTGRARRRTERGCRAPTGGLSAVDRSTGRARRSRQREGHPG